MILFFDTETTTFPNPKISATALGQARIVQLAWLLTDDKLEELGCFSGLVRIPENVKISEGASKAHGITEEKCKKYGVGIEHALGLFLEQWKCCNAVVAHNIPFDIDMLKIEHEILFGPLNYSPPAAYCTMRSMTPICRLPHASGRRFGSEYKWPKLQEAYKYCFGNEFGGAHDALADVRATAKVFKWLVDNKHIKL